MCPNSPHALLTFKKCDSLISFVIQVVMLKVLRVSTELIGVRQEQCRGLNETTYAKSEGVI